MEPSQAKYEYVDLEEVERPDTIPELQRKEEKAKEERNTLPSYLPT